MKGRDGSPAEQQVSLLSVLIESVFCTTFAAGVFGFE